jgi:hypothetical protein
MLNDLFSLQGTQAPLAPLKAAATPEKPGKIINIASIDGIFVNPLETYS